jgi:hypothetical protein
MRGISNPLSDEDRSSNALESGAAPVALIDTDCAALGIKVTNHMKVYSRAYLSSFVFISPDVVKLVIDRIYFALEDQDDAQEDQYR